MGMPELVVAAVLEQGRSKSEVARTYGVSRRWVITLVQRFRGRRRCGARTSFAAAVAFTDADTTGHRGRDR
jgi:transposase-like protein